MLLLQRHVVVDKKVYLVLATMHLGAVTRHDERRKLKPDLV